MHDERKIIAFEALEVLCRLQKCMRKLACWYSAVFGVADYEPEL